MSAMDIKTSANAFNQAVRGLDNMGIDVQPMQVMTGAMQTVSGAATAWRAIQAISQRKTAVNQAKFTAAIAKYGPMAFVFAGVAIGVGLTVEHLITKSQEDVDRA